MHSPSVRCLSAYLTITTWDTRASRVSHESSGEAASPRDPRAVTTGEDRRSATAAVETLRRGSLGQGLAILSEIPEPKALERVSASTFPRGALGHLYQVAPAS